MYIWSAASATSIPDPFDNIHLAEVSNFGLSRLQDSRDQQQKLLLVNTVTGRAYGWHTGEPTRTHLHRPGPGTSTWAVTAVFPFRVSHRCNEVISTASANSHPRSHTLPLFRVHTPLRVHMDTIIALSSSRLCPFLSASLLFRLQATRPAIYVGYLCNGSGWLPARSTNTGTACTRQSHTKPDRNLYPILLASATN